MKSKSSNMNKKIIYYQYHALLGLFVGAFISLSLHGLQNVGVSSVENVTSATGAILMGLKNKVRDTFIALVVKLVHFFVAKSLQFQFVPPLQAEPSTASMMFWVALTRAVASMPDDTLY